MVPHQCTLDTDCPETQSCIQHNCSDPCSFVDCGLNTICTVVDHTATCQCQPGYIGDSSGCFKVECLSNNDCPSDKYCNQETNKCSGKHITKLYVNKNLQIISHCIYSFIF